MIDANYFHNLPPGQSIFYVAQQLNVPCVNIFVSAVVKDLKNNLPAMDKPEIYNLANEACNTQNPDIVWQIFKVETNFRVHIVNLGGKKTLVGRAAKNYVENDLKKDDNADIGSLQINWRANGSRFNYEPEQYFNGSFSVRFISAHLLKDLVISCKTDWINCYHSHNPKRGGNYREKIEKSGNDLKKILYNFLKI